MRNEETGPEIWWTELLTGPRPIVDLPPPTTASVNPRQLSYQPHYASAPLPISLYANSTTSLTLQRRANSVVSHPYDYVVFIDFQINF